MKYVKLIKDITHNENGILIPVKEGTILEKIATRGYSGYQNQEIFIPENIVRSNPGYFVEITKSQWNEENQYSRIVDLILSEDPYIDWNSLVNEIRNRFLESDELPEWIKAISDQNANIPSYPMPQTPQYPGVIDSTMCPSCGNLKGSACWSTTCPYRIHVWYSSSTSGKTE